MYILVVYDISGNGARQRLASYLKSRGFTRIQRSAFIGRPLPSVARDVERVLPSFISSKADVIHLFPLLEYSIEHMAVYGRPLSQVSVARGVLVVK